MAFIYRVSLEYSNPYDRKERDAAFRRLYDRPRYPTDQEVATWQKENPIPMENVQRLVAIDNPLGEGAATAAIKRVIGEDIDIADWWVVVKQIEYVGDVCIDDAVEPRKEGGD